MNKANVRGFTVQELLVGMVVASMVITMVYTIINHITGQLNAFKEHGDVIMEYNQLKMVLDRDIYHSTEYKFKENELILVNGKSEIRYHFKDKYMVRNNQKSMDTLWISNRVLSTEDITPDVFGIQLSLFDGKYTYFASKEKKLNQRINQYFLK